MSPPSEPHAAGSLGEIPGSLLTPREVAGLLACSVKAVYAWAARGLLPHVKLGRLTRFTRADVAEFVRSNRVPVDGQPPPGT